jgi:hypothetical protein
MGEARPSRPESLESTTFCYGTGRTAMKGTPKIVKEPAANHRYGLDIARGPYVYVAYDGDKLVAVAATAGEARRLYAKAWSAWCLKPCSKRG